MKEQHGSRTPLEIDYEALRQKSVSELLQEQEAIWKEQRSAAGEWIVAYETVLKEKGYIAPGWDSEAQLKRVKAKAPSLFPSRQEDREETPKKKTHPRSMRILRAIPAIAATLCGLLIIASATGVGQWLIEFKDGAYMFFNASGQIEIEASDVSDYSSLQDALDKNGITAPIAPTWIPSRFALESVKVMDMDDTLVISAHYPAENRDALNVFINTDSSMYAAEGSEDETLEIYECRGIEFQITSNFDQVSVFWKSGSCCCQIAGNLTISETKAMINSIF